MHPSRIHKLTCSAIILLSLSLSLCMLSPHPPFLTITVFNCPLAPPPRRRAPSPLPIASRLCPALPPAPPRLSRYTSINYLKSWFFIDLLSCLPIDSVMRITAAADESPGGDGDGDASALTGSLKVAKLAKLFKNIRLLRLARIAKMVARYSNALPNTGQIVRIFLAFLFFTHCCGCFFLFVSNTFSDDPTKSWTWGAGINPVLKPASQGRAYIIGSFNALLMLFGTQAMPEHTHQTDAELITVIVILLIGSVCHATLYGQMAHLMTQLNSSSTKYGWFLCLTKVTTCLFQPKHSLTHSLINHIAVRSPPSFATSVVQEKVQAGGSQESSPHAGH